jgi:hypothetical protein
MFSRREVNRYPSDERRQASRDDSEIDHDPLTASGACPPSQRRVLRSASFNGIRSYRGDCRDRERARVPVDCRDRPARSVHPRSRRVDHDSRPRRSRTERVSLAANQRGALRAQRGSGPKISFSTVRFVAIDVHRGVPTTHGEPSPMTTRVRHDVRARETSRDRTRFGVAQ